MTKKETDPFSKDSLCHQCYNEYICWDKLTKWGICPDYHGFACPGFKARLSGETIDD